MAEQPLTAAELAERALIEDPFPNVPPALLNWRDIARYVKATGMIDPFREDAEYLKPASYRVPVLGEYLYWDDKNQPHRDQLLEGRTLLVQPNSITFVSVEPTFRLPLYIAARFNLKVRNVYRGLLLGTGPMIDPGFQGRLYIPLHNLTTNEYTFTGGEVLIWVEFTKLSQLPELRRTPDGSIREVFKTDDQEELRAPFRLPEPNRTLLQYVQEAADMKSVRSSVPEIVGRLQQKNDELQDAVDASALSVDRAEAQVEEARTQIQNANNRLTAVGILGGLAALAAVLALFLQLQASIIGLNGRIDQVPTRPSASAIAAPTASPTLSTSPSPSPARTP